MSIASGLGMSIDISEAAGPAHAVLFGEDQARYVVTVPADMGNFLMVNAEGAGVPFRKLGTVGGDTFAVEGLLSLDVSQLRNAHESWFPDYMEATAAEAAE